MKIFHCTFCGGLIFFENTTCLQCGHLLAFLPDVLEMSAFDPAPHGGFKAVAAGMEGKIYRPCDNARHKACNWAVSADDEQTCCISCRLNVLIPDLSVPQNLDSWQKLELAKRRMLYTLLALRLPLAGDPRLRFQFPVQMEKSPPVLTGHAQGLITVNLAEADDAVRERQRSSLHEPLRTLLGHFRHEVGHYYWDRFIKGSPVLDRFRQAFGDERQDYGQALEKYYRTGPAPDWSRQNVSAYASAHPWEDWAETWAHYLHIKDALETATGFGLSLKPRHPAVELMAAEPKRIGRKCPDFDATMKTWFPLAYALNSLNRGMGLTDLYPFVLSHASIDKLRFVHEIIAEYTGAEKEGEGVAIDFPAQNQQPQQAVV